MKITRYSKDVDILTVEVSDGPIAYAEEAGRFIVHFSEDGEPVLLEIMDAKDFVLESLDSMLTATMDEGVVYVLDKKDANASIADDEIEQIYQDRAATSKYHKLYSHLCNLAEQEWPTSFRKVEAIVGFGLPKSAYIHRAWWANEMGETSYTHSLAWRAAGWKTAEVDMKAQSLLFRRIRKLAAPKDRLSEILPVRSVGAWPEGLSLRREDIYDERV